MGIKQHGHFEPPVSTSDIKFNRLVRVSVLVPQFFLSRGREEPELVEEDLMQRLNLKLLCFLMHSSLLIIRLLKTENYPNVEKATGCSVEGSFSIGIALGAGFILF